MKDLSITFDYSKYSTDLLLILIKTHLPYSNQSRLDVIESKKRVLDVLTKRYFENKSSFNLYHILAKHNPYYMKETTFIEYMLKLIYIEMNDSVEIPESYRLDFITVIYNFLTSLERLCIDKEIDFEIKWDAFPKLVDYLANISVKDVTTENQRVNINKLIQRIKKEYSANVKRADVIPIQSNTPTVSERVNELKEFKLVKSKLTKAVLEGIFPNFMVYSEKDKIYLANLIKKKGYFEFVKDIPPVDGFKFFSEHLELVDGHRYFNPFEYLYLWFKNVCSLYLTKESDVERVYFSKWKEYYGLSDFESVISFIRNYYFSFEGSTERGFDLYLLSCLKSFRAYEHAYLNSSDLFYKLIEKELRGYVVVFEKFKGKSLVEFTKEGQMTFGYKMDKLPIIQDGKLVEFIIQDTVRNEYITEYKKRASVISNLMYSFDGFYTIREKGTEELIYVDSNYPENIIEILTSFYRIPLDIVFKAEDLNEIESRIDIGWFLRYYFCYHYYDLSKELAYSFLYNKENLRNLNSFVKFMSSGCMHSYSEYLEVFYLTLKDEISFKDKELLNIVLDELPEDLRELYPYIVKDIKEGYPELYQLCTEFFNINIEDKSQALVMIREIITIFKGYFEN